MDKQTNYARRVILKAAEILAQDVITFLVGLKEKDVTAIVALKEALLHLAIDENIEIDAHYFSQLKNQLNRLITQAETINQLQV